MMIRPKSGFSLLSFLDRERISEGDSEDVSSIKNLDLLSKERVFSVSYTHLRAHETSQDLVCRLLLEKKNKIVLQVCWKVRVKASIVCMSVSEMKMMIRKN